MTWRPLGSVLPEKLTAARLQLHYAAQLVSAPGASLLAKTDDHSHTNMAWDLGLGVLAGRPVGEGALRAALVFESLELAVLDGPREKASHALSGSTIERSLAWLTEQLSCDEGQVRLPDHEMPSHALAEGATFSDSDQAARSELAAWFSDATSALHEAVSKEAGASPVRCWPHHFDVASLIALDPDARGEEARTIGLGLSPGDDAYDQPYFYVTPWPYPERDRFPTLPSAAHWHTAGWTGAVLRADALVSAHPHQQPRLVGEVLAAAVEACRDLLGD